MTTKTHRHWIDIKAKNIKQYTVNNISIPVILPAMGDECEASPVLKETGQQEVITLAVKFPNY